MCPVQFVTYLSGLTSGTVSREGVLEALETMVRRGPGLSTVFAIAVVLPIIGCSAQHDRFIGAPLHSARRIFHAPWGFGLEGLEAAITDPFGEAGRRKSICLRGGGCDVREQPACGDTNPQRRCPLGVH